MPSQHPKVHYHVVYSIPALRSVLLVQHFRKLRNEQYAPPPLRCANNTSQKAAEASFWPASHFLALIPRFGIVEQLQELSFLGTLWFLETHIPSFICV
jgi:hypothetical protein